MSHQDDPEKVKACRDKLYRELVPVRPDGPGSVKIRVLTVDNICGSGETAKVEGTLTDVDLRDPGRIPFDALSYQWGDETPTRPVLCNGLLEVDVTVNGFEALAHLYRLHQSRGTLPLTIWIDQVCINQEDNDEKYGEQDAAGPTTVRGQLDLMAEIYPSAATTYLWLGVGTPATTHAMNYLAQGSLPPTLGLGVAGRGLATAWRIVTMYWLRHDGGLADVAGRGWVGRVWTLQEAVLARHAEVVCGDAAVPWPALICAAQFYDVAMAGHGARFFSVVPPVEWRRWADLIHFWLESREVVALVDGGAVSAIATSDAESEGLQKPRRAEVLAGELAEFRAVADRACLIGGSIWIAVYFLTWMFFGINLVAIGMMIGVHWDTTNANVNRVLPGFRLTLIPGGILLILLVLRIWWSSRLQRSHRGLSEPLTPIGREESVVREVLRRDCVKVKDKWFGVKALIANDDISGPTYAENLSQVYHHLTIRMLQETGYLDMLLVGSYIKAEDCPSWVIDWRKPKNATADPNKEAVHPRVRLWLDLQYYYHHGETVTLRRFEGPTRGSSPSWNRQKLEEEKELEVRGYILTEISKVDTSLLHVRGGKNAQEDLESGVSANTSLLQAGGEENAEEGDFEAGVAAFRDVMQGLEPAQLDICTQYLLRVAESELKSPFLDFVGWRELVQQSELNSVEAARRLKMPRWGAMRNIALPVHELLSSFVYRTQTALVRCSGDGYSGFGVASPDTQVGDRVCLIAGVSLPMILRPGPNGHQVVGPSFFGGLMDGRAWEGVESAAEFIRLC